MARVRQLSCLACRCGICFVTLLAPTTAAAFCRTNTCETDVDNPDCHYDAVTGCLTGGQWLFWSTSCVSFSIQAAASPALGISYEQAAGTISKIMSTWTDTHCDGELVSMAAIQFPSVACDVVEYNQNRTEGPNANLWMFRDGGWPYDDGGRTLGLTSVWFNAKTGEIYDADVEINSDEAALVAASGATLAEIAMHEAGHFYGLAHSADMNAIMYETYSPANGIASALSIDDQAGMCAMYPPGREATCNPTPRHGFGPQCGGEVPSCRAAAPGNNRGTMGAGWILLGLLLRGGRPRLWSRRGGFRCGSIGDFQVSTVSTETHRHPRKRVPEKTAAHLWLAGITMSGPPGPERAIMQTK